MNHQARDPLYELMPLRVTPAALEFFKDSFRVIDFEEYVDWVSATLDEMGRNTGRLLLSADKPSPEKDVELFRRLERDGMAAVERWAKFESFHAEGMFARMVDSFLTYLTDLLAAIYRSKPQALRSGEQVRIDEVLRHATMDELVEFLCQRKVHQLSYEGMTALHAILEKELSFSLFEVPLELERAVLLVEKRNLVAHARGVVNKVFLQRQPMSEHSLGERLKFDRSQIAQDLLFLARAVARADVAAVEKFKIDQSTLRDRPKRRVP